MLANTGRVWDANHRLAFWMRWNLWVQLCSDAVPTAFGTPGSQTINLCSLTPGTVHLLKPLNRLPRLRWRFMYTVRWATTPWFCKLTETFRIRDHISSDTKECRRWKSCSKCVPIVAKYVYSGRQRNQVYRHLVGSLGRPAISPLLSWKSGVVALLPFKHTNFKIYKYKSVAMLGI